MSYLKKKPFFDDKQASEFESQSPGYVAQFENALDFTEKAIEKEFVDKLRIDWSANPRSFKKARILLGLNQADIETLRAEAKKFRQCCKRYTRAAVLEGERDDCEGHSQTTYLRKVRLEFSMRRLDAVVRKLALKSLLPSIENQSRTDMRSLLTPSPTACSPI